MSSAFPVHEERILYLVNILILATTALSFAVIALLTAGMLPIMFVSLVYLPGLLLTWYYRGKGFLAATGIGAAMLVMEVLSSPMSGSLFRTPVIVLLLFIVYLAICGLMAIVSALIHREHQRVQEISDSTGTALIITAPDRSVRVVNKEFEALFGYGAKEVVGVLSVDAFFSNEGRAMISRALTRGAGDHPSVFETRGRTKDGDARDVLVTFTMYPAGSEAIMSVIDISSRTMAQTSLVEANRKLALLSGLTRHDVHNQLAVILSSVDIMQDAGCGKGDPVCSGAISAIGRAAETIRQQVAFMKDYEDIGVRIPQWLNVRSAFDAAAKDVPLNRTGVTIDAAGADVGIYADPMLARVALNLVDNSFRHGGDYLSCITVRAEPAGDGTLRITYEDDGDGVPAVDKERVFEKGVGSNTGYGLFLIREVLGITGIAIHEAGPPGGGARFELVVPEGKWR